MATGIQLLLPLLSTFLAQGVEYEPSLPDLMEGLGAGPIYYVVQAGGVDEVPKSATAVRILGARYQDIRDAAKLRNLTHLDVTTGFDEESLPASTVDLLLEMDGLESLVMHGQVHLTADKEAFTKLGEHPGLRELVLGQTGYLLDGHVVAFAENSRIERLTVFMEPGIQKGGFAALASIPTLEHFAISYPNFQTDLIDAFRSATSLRSFSLHGCDELGDQHARWLSSIEGLERVDLGRTVVTGDGVRALASLKRLKSLRLGFAEGAVDDKLAAFIAETWPDLEELDVRGAAELGCAGVAELVKLRKLHTLELGGCEGLDEHCLELLAAATELRHLDLQGNSWVGDEACAALAMLPLESLRVGSPAIGGKGITSLSKIESLRLLDLSGSDRASEGAAAMGRMKNLQLLALHGCESVDGKTMKSLRKLKNLRFLGIQDCRGLERQDLNKFRDARPACFVDG